MNAKQCSVRRYHGNDCIHSQKARLETRDAEFTDENTTWFDPCKDDEDIYLSTDFEEDILIGEFGYGYSVRICGLSRDGIGYDQGKRLKS